MGRRGVCVKNPTKHPSAATFVQIGRRERASTHSIGRPNRRPSRTAHTAVPLLAPAAAGAPAQGADVDQSEASLPARAGAASPPAPCEAQQGGHQ
eukprot:5366616-Prymnesium_polylepis.1